MDPLKKLTTLKKAKFKKLKKAQKAAVIEDFTNWSGFPPEDCGAEEIDAYVESAMDSNLDTDAVYNFLMGLIE